MDRVRLKDKSPEGPGIFPVRCEDYGRRTIELRAFWDGEHWELIRNKGSFVELKDIIMTHWARESSPVWVKVEERHPGNTNVYAVQSKDELGTLRPFTAYWTGQIMACSAQSSVDPRRGYALAGVAGGDPVL